MNRDELNSYKVIIDGKLVENVDYIIENTCKETLIKCKQNGEELVTVLNGFATGGASQGFNSTNCDSKCGPELVGTVAKEPLNKESLADKIAEEVEKLVKNKAGIREVNIKGAGLVDEKFFIDGVEVIKPHVIKSNINLKKHR